MSMLGKFLVAVVTILVVLVSTRLNHVPPLPPLQPQPWWSDRPRPLAEDTRVTRFMVDVKDEAVADLRARLRLPTRLTPAVSGSNSTYGLHVDVVEDVVHYWLTKYDWKARLQYINSYNHYKTRIQGLDVHFVRALPSTGSGGRVVPLLLLHGWPGSVLEFYDLLPLLTAPQHPGDVVFEVVAPSIPGYGFSEAASKPGLNTAEVARMFVELMARLGHQKFFCQGGDWGSSIATSIAQYYPDRVHGIHLNFVTLVPDRGTFLVLLGSVLPSGWVMDQEFEKHWYPYSEKILTRLLRESGYLHIQATKPDTLGVALNSSPAGLAAYILEKFNTWTYSEEGVDDPGKLLSKNFPIHLDRILDNICWYWFTGSITTSMRLYKETISNTELQALKNVPVTVPAGVTLCEGELIKPPPNILKLGFPNLKTFTYREKVGHFAAMEAPQQLAEDIRAFVAAAASAPR